MVIIIINSIIIIDDNNKWEQIELRVEEIVK